MIEQAIAQGREMLERYQAERAALRQRLRERGKHLLERLEALARHLGRIRREAFGGDVEKDRASFTGLATTQLRLLIYRGLDLLDTDLETHELMPAAILWLADILEREIERLEKLTADDLRQMWADAE